MTILKIPILAGLGKEISTASRKAPAFTGGNILLMQQMVFTGQIRKINQSLILAFNSFSS